MPPTEPATYRLSATDWALRAGVALVFTVFALEKLIGTSWVRMFEEIGLGQWFRHFTGFLQLGGSVLLLAPRTARLGAALIGITMAGAMVTHLAVLDTGVGARSSPARSCRSPSQRDGTVAATRSRTSRRLRCGDALRSRGARATIGFP